MSTTYKTVLGDTFESVSRKVFGHENNAGLIAEQNPGVVEPIPNGVLLFVEDSEVPQSVPSQGTSYDPDEIQIAIGTRVITRFESFRNTRSIDSMSTVSFVVPFDPSDEEDRETYRPFKYKQIKVTRGGVPFFFGVVLGVEPTATEKRVSVTVTAYSRPGVLNECTPTRTSKLEFIGMNLHDIAASLIKPFGLRIESDTDVGPVFDRVACTSGRTVLSFLVTLAQQRGILVSDTTRGALHFLKGPERNAIPEFIFEEGAQPLLSVTPAFSPQAYFSHITAIQPAVLEGIIEGDIYTVRNEHLEGVLRPMTFNAADNQDATIKESANAKIGRMFAGAMGYSIEVVGWMGDVGQVIEITAPNSMIYEASRFVIKQITFKITSEGRITEMKLALPGAFTGEQPFSLPWD